MMDVKPKTTSYSLSSPMEQLRQLTDVLLLSANQGELDDAALKLHALLSLISGMNNDREDSSDSLSIVLPIGEAISPRDAARCLVDSARTAKFLRGISAALLAARQRFPDGPVEILYAGCGPFATLAIPLTTRFKADQIRFTLLDIHARSLESARRVIEAFGMEDYVLQYVQSEAASYVHPRPLHMVITETMQKALSKEPQVAITLNLAPQLCPGGIFIPERVTIDAYLCAPDKEPVPGSRDRDETASATRRAGGARVKLGRVFELTAENAIGLAKMSGQGRRYAEAYLLAAAIDLPKEITEGLRLALSTTITVFEMMTLGEYESGLTHPLWFYDFGGAGGAGRIVFQYCLRGEPGFKWQIPV